MRIIRKIGFFTAFILPLLVFTGFYLRGWWSYSTLIFVFGVIPFLDYLSGLDKTNVAAHEVDGITEDRFYRFVTYLWATFQVAFLAWAAYAVASGTFTNTLDLVRFTISVGVVTGGIGITVAHELGHKNTKLEQFFSKVILMTVCYMHFYIEHNRGHHVHVATPQDPATAKKDEPFYIFWFRSVIGSFVHAWHLEINGLQRKNVPVFSLQNQMLQFIALPIFFAGSLLVFVFLLTQQWQFEVLAFFFGQSIVAFTLLELVNYIEHYGILRKQLPSGRYETVNPLHSWNASHLISNFFLFQLQRHSDHHAFASKRYQVLNHYDESPQLPFGYPTMIIIALFPPLWFRLMNNRLEVWKVERENSIQPTRV
jgi:alkane 1-monooxygenase